MPGYNSKFDLSVSDIDLIEAALHQQRADLSARVVTDGGAAAPADDNASDDDTTLRHIHDLLGRLHNQKVFYRPRRGAYIGG
ncbi:hypothetical protein ACROSR_10025 [Roseovarius tibetensis]|uniref:hypothetical protein n=1 Tax=Roseovarius tibetensis TaxID=2685897 RepID=UPI003D7FD119